MNVPSLIMFEFLFFLGAFVAEIIGTITGFGSSTIFLPIALFFFDFKTALILVAAFHIFGNLGRIAFFRHGVDNRILLLFGVPSVVLTIIGALLVSSLSQSILKLILGTFLLMFSILSLAKPELAVPKTKTSAVIGGSISGFFAGLIGTGGALRGAFLTAFRMRKVKYIATAAAIALLVDITRIPIYFAEGFLQFSYYWYLPVLFLIAIGGSFAGKQVVKKIPPKIFRILVLIALAFMGILFVIQGLG